MPPRERGPGDGQIVRLVFRREEDVGVEDFAEPRRQVAHEGSLYRRDAPAAGRSIRLPTSALSQPGVSRPPAIITR